MLQKIKQFEMKENQATQELKTINMECKQLKAMQRTKEEEEHESNITRTKKIRINNQTIST